MSEKPYPEPPGDGVGPVAAPAGARPDWRDGGSYRYLLELDNEGWAWEWLRRNPAYREYAKLTPVEKGGSKTLNPVPAGRDGADWGVLFR